MSEEYERHSRALEPELVADPDEIARIKARNGVRQVRRRYGNDRVLLLP